MKPVILLLSVILIFLLLTVSLRVSLQNNNTLEKPSPVVSPAENHNLPFIFPSGFSIKTFAKDLGKPRVLKFSPGGTLLVSDIGGNRVVALPDSDKNGVADSQKVVVVTGNRIHGIALYGNYLFVAEVDKVVRYRWDETALTAIFDKSLFSLPPNNNHYNRTITFDQKGNMYVSVGSTCNVCNEISELSASVVISNANGENPHVFAKGLRNAPFTVIHPQTQEVWGTEMGRDHLGDDLPPDEINIIKSGNNYGWPLCYGNKIHDTNFDKSGENPCGITQSPIFEIPAHSAPLGLVFIDSPQFPNNWQGDLLISYHGSWNRSIPTGYKIVRLEVEGNTIVKAEDFLTGFINGENVRGRPVDLAFDEIGNLYISDDKAGNIYIVRRIDQ